MKNVFVVDDSITTLKLAERALKEKYQLTLLTSGKQLFMALNRRIPDLILLDIEMPDMSGIEVLKQLKTVSGWQSIPVIFLTSHTEQQIVSEGFEQGVLDYIIKPFDSSLLPERIEKFLNG